MPIRLLFYIYTILMNLFSSCIENAVQVFVAKKKDA